MKESAIDALAVVCETCGAKARNPCVRIVGPNKGTPLDAPHFLRVKRAKEKAGLKTCPTCHGSGVVR